MDDNKLTSESVETDAGGPALNDKAKLGPKKRRGKAQQWVLIEEFATDDEFNEWMSKIDSQLVINYTRTIRDGKKVYYRCPFGRKVGWEKCNYQLCAIRSTLESKVIVKSRKENHFHRRVNEAIGKNAIPEELKQVIVEGILNNLLPSTIIRNLRKRTKDIPTRKQIYNFILQFALASMH